MSYGLVCLSTLEFSKHFKSLKPKLNFSFQIEIHGGSDGKHLSTMRETQVWALGWEDPLEKEMAIHSSTVAWKIPWTEKPGRLQSMGSQRVGHDWASSLSLWRLKLPSKVYQSWTSSCRVNTVCLELSLLLYVFLKNYNILSLFFNITNLVWYIR